MTAPPSPPSLVIVDVETSGLDEHAHTILEIAIVVTDVAMRPLAQIEQVIVDDTSIEHLQWLYRLATEEPDHQGVEPWKSAKIVWEMHRESGLAQDIHAMYVAGQRNPRDQVQRRCVDFMHSLGLDGKMNRLAMAGSSVSLDRAFIRAQMPDLFECFHYRIEDISSLKMAVERWRTDIVAKRNAERRPNGAHRALSDCYDSLGEYEFYVTNLLATPR